MLLPHVTHYDATPTMGLATKTKNVQVKEFNQGGVLHTHQEEDLNIRRQIPIVKDTLRHGDMKLIKEVLEVPIAHSSTGHVTTLVTLLHIAMR